MAKQIIGKELFGIVDEIVQSVRDKTIDLDYVFSKAYIVSRSSKSFNPYEQVALFQSWLNSLPYILSVPPKNRGKVFGTLELADGSKCDGTLVACYVLKNICAQYYMTGDMFLHPQQCPTYVPDILKNAKDIWACKETIIYCPSSSKNSISIMAHYNQVVSDLTTIDNQSETDLIELVEFCVFDEKDPHVPQNFGLKPFDIRGFMAALIYAMLIDALRRKIFVSNWYDANKLPTFFEDIVTRTITNNDLPVNLHVPALEVIDNYLPIALRALHKKLHFNDNEYEESDDYVMRKMLEIELAQCKKLNKIELWNAFPDKVQHTLLQYERFFIKYLNKKLGNEQDIETVLQEVTEQQELKPTDNPYFCCITESTRAKGFAQQVENELRSACISAPKLIKCINDLETQGHLDTKNLGNTSLYNKLNEHFHLKYGLRNFSKYRSDPQKNKKK